MRWVRRIAIVLVLCGCAIAPEGRAQANVPQYRGDFGMAAGTLPAPGAYLGLFYNDYRADRVNDVNGEAFSTMRPAMDVAALAGSYTFPLSFAGAHWAVAASVPWTTIGLETVDLDFEGKWGLGDLYLQPVKLGWSTKDADFVTGFGVYMPTGRFHAGAPDNNGLGMWSYEGSAGTTIHIRGQGSASTLVSYQIQSKIRDTDKRAGQLLTLEGGVGYSILKDVGQIGLVYYAHWKTTSDQGFDLPPVFDGRSRMFGLGPEITVPFPLPGLVGIMTVRYYTEVANRVATQGDSFIISLTLHRPSLSR